LGATGERTKVVSGLNFESELAEAVSQSLSLERDLGQRSRTSSARSRDGGLGPCHGHAELPKAEERLPWQLGIGANRPVCTVYVGKLLDEWPTPVVSAELEEKDLQLVWRFDKASQP
jgi:hypothetical protein